MATIWHHREKTEASPCITTTSYMRELNIYRWIRVCGRSVRTSFRYRLRFSIQSPNTSGTGTCSANNSQTPELYKGNSKVH